MLAIIGELYTRLYGVIIELKIYCMLQICLPCSLTVISMVILAEKRILHVIVIFILFTVIMKY